MMPIRLPCADDLTSPAVQQRTTAAYEALLQGGARGGAADQAGSLRRVVRESWKRSRQYLPDPEKATAPLRYAEEELAEYRESHPLAAVLPVIQRLLVQPSLDAGLLVAIGDENGRLLWVDGDRDLRRTAEEMTFVAGSDWSERAVGTCAPGTALALGRSVQIAGAEHYSPQVHAWSCTAVPVHDPDSGTVLGVVDITGKSEAVAVHSLSLVQATVAAAEAELRVHRLQSRLARRQMRRTGQVRRTAKEQSKSLYRDSLQVLGQDHGVLHVGAEAVQLSIRHAELLTLLALHPEGLRAEQLAVMAYPEGVSATTVRAEMLRLRRVLGAACPALVPESRPYRLPLELAVDARQVLNCLQRGAHRMALNIYRGPVLPRSEAPAVARLRSDVSAQLRGAILSDAAPETLLQYLQLPEAENDAEAWLTALRVLPPRSPKRAAVVARLERLEAELHSA
jgi:hypothetical protein